MLAVFSALGEEVMLIQQFQINIQNLPDYGSARRSRAGGANAESINLNLELRMLIGGCRKSPA